MNETITLLYNKFDKLVSSSFLAFDEVAALKDQMGVYVIFEEEQILYVGKTNKFHVRFGTNMKHENTHTLVRKIIKSGRFKDRYEVIQFLSNACKIKIEVCNSNREAEALESIAILILDPVLNKN
jgi:excinuclease UvrABC nuclease subunit